jgi:hypothetical protein
MGAYIRTGLIGLCIMLVAACAQTSKQINTSFKPAEGPYKLVLMKPDIEVSLLTAGGLNEPNREWTEQARSGVFRALETNNFGRGGSLIKFTELSSSAEQTQINTDLENLYRAVATSIYVHKYMGATLPTKKDKFDWTLGPQAQQLGAQANADYALFVYARDSFSSAGRKAMQFFMAAAGVGIAGGVQFGYVSLVNLKTGEVVWFNTLTSSVGDIRTPGGAANMVSSLLASMPLGPKPVKK